MATTTNLDSLVINYLTQEQYDEAQQAGTLNANQLYLTPDTGPAAGGTVTSITAGNGLSGGTISTSGTISHADTSSQASSSNSGRTYIQSVTLDTYGHVTGLTTATESVTNSDTKVNVIARGTNKAYLLGTTTSPTSSAQAVTSVAETGVYFDTTAATLVATTFKGALTGTASGNLTANSSLNAAKLTGTVPSGCYTNTWTAMVGATSSANGSIGYVNATPPKDGYNTKFLRADGTWSVPAYPIVPTKTSDLTNDGDGTSAFATMADIGSFGGGTITEVKTNAGSHTTIDVTSGKAEFNIPTKTSHLTNDSNFITSSVIGFSNLTSDSATITLNGVGYSFSRTDTKLQVEDLTTNYTSSVTHRIVLRSNGTTAATGYISNIYFSHVGGSTSSQGYAGLILGNEKATGTNGNSTGKLTLYASNDKYTQIVTNTLTSNNVVTLPSGTGTLALTSEIPSSTGSSTTGITASTTATKTTLGTAFTIPNVTSAGSASTWAFEEVSIPNVTAAGSASTWAFEEVSIPNVTAAGSASTWTFGATTVGDGTLVGAVDSSDSSMLVITAGTKSVQQKTGGGNGAAPTIGTAIKVQSKKSGANGTAPTIGTAIKVQSKKSGANGSAPTLGTAFTVPNVTGNTSATVSISDSGHTHTLS